MVMMTLNHYLQTDDSRPRDHGATCRWHRNDLRRVLLIGLGTRLAALQTLGIMAVAILATKIRVLRGSEFLGLSLRHVPYHGFPGFAHESRTDWSMAIGSIYLNLAGASRWSIDRWLTHN